MNDRNILLVAGAGVHLPLLPWDTSSAFAKLPQFERKFWIETPICRLQEIEHAATKPLRSEKYDPRKAGEINPQSRAAPQRTPLDHLVKATRTQLRIESRLYGLGSSIIRTSRDIMFLNPFPVSHALLLRLTLLEQLCQTRVSLLLQVFVNSAFGKKPKNIWGNSGNTSILVLTPCFLRAFSNKNA